MIDPRNQTAGYNQYIHTITLRTVLYLETFGTDTAAEKMMRSESAS